MERKLMNLKAVLIDLSGTIHVENSLIQGAIQAIEKLRNSKIKFVFATNTSKESKNSLIDKLGNLGLNLKENQVFTSLTAAYRFVKENKHKPYLVLEESAKKDFLDKSSIDLENADSVVIGLAQNKFNYNEMNLIFNFLLKEDTKLIAINKSKYFETKNGLSIGPGAFIEALEYATSKKAIVIGKPNENFFYQAMKSIDENLNFENVAMIGDDIKDDVLSAQSCGMIGILVRTGKYRKDCENEYNQKANFIFDSIVEAIDFILTK